MSNRSLRIIDCLLFWSVIFCLLVVPQLIDNYWSIESEVQSVSTSSATTLPLRVTRPVSEVCLVPQMMPLVAAKSRTATIC